MIALLLLLLAAQDLPTNPPRIRRNIGADTVAIIEAIVQERLASKGEAPPGDYLVVADRTLRFCPRTPEPPQDENCIFPDFAEGMWQIALPPVQAELKARFLRENTTSVAIPPLHIPAARVVPAHTIAQIFSGKGWWSEFYRRYPRSRGYLSMSSPAFSVDNQNALVYVSHSCGGLCGTGWFVYLSRSDGRWRIVDKHMLWIS